MIQAILAIAQIVLLVLRYLEHRGKVNEARRAVEQDLHRLRVKLGQSADAAVDKLDTSPDGVRDDPNNRDNDVRGDDRPADSL